MKLSKQKFKRSQPLLGTFVSILLEGQVSEASAQAVFLKAFCEIKKLEKIFSFHDPKSDLSNLNSSLANIKVTVNGLLYDLIESSFRLWQSSKGAFNLFATDIECRDPLKFCFSNVLEKTCEFKIDLGGTAKGFIVDQVVKNIVQKEPQLSGAVNAGGDIRFFGQFENEVDLRLGSAENIIFQRARINRPCVATSSSFGLKLNSKSSTKYRGISRRLEDGFTFVAVASSLQVADSLTKVALFAERQLIKKLCKSDGAEVFVFDSNAQLVETMS